MEIGHSALEGLPLGWDIGSKIIMWVRWSNVCKPKSGGGLVVRDLRAVYVSLRGKWRWKLLTGGDALWRQVLMSKYDHHSGSMDHFDHPPIPLSTSVWWKDVCFISNWQAAGRYWISDHYRMRVGDGNVALFWHDV